MRNAMAEADLDTPNAGRVAHARPLGSAVYRMAYGHDGMDPFKCGARSAECGMTQDCWGGLLAESLWLVEAADGAELTELHD
jgi:hypothetical protein